MSNTDPLSGFGGEKRISSSSSPAVVHDEELYSDLPPEKAGTSADQRDMARMGKTQQFKRNFGLAPALGFAAGLMCTWESTFSSVSYSLGNGGLAGMIWMFVVALVGFGAAILSMAEMASMAPTSGGQYHWISEFAPKSYQKILSYTMGWFGVLGWQAGIAGQCFTVALQVQGMIILNDENYAPQPWHAVLITIATVSIAVVFNTLLAKHLPKLESFVLVLHVVGFFAILIPLWVLAPRNGGLHDSLEVWTDFEVYNGWSSVGLACLVGFTGPVFTLIGPDCVVHIAEEVHDASRTLPLAMLGTLLLNGLSGLIMMITYAYTLGPIPAALQPQYNFAFIGSFATATSSTAGATVMTAIISLLILCSAISNLATGSRQMFAFARDGGLPFSRTLARVHGGLDVPLNAVVVSWVITALLSLINLGSSVPFNAILAIGVVALLSSYAISIACVLWKRVRGEELLPRRWSLGPRWGLVCNVVGLAYTTLAYVFAFFPVGVPVDATNMNWACAVYGGVAIVAVVWYFVHARKVYVPPVSRLAKDL